MKKLKIHRRQSMSGRTDSAVVFLHGYGADAADLLGLADVLAPHLPDTVFLAPDAPEACKGNPFGFQWFPVPWLDGSAETALRTSLASSTAMLRNWLGGLPASDGVTTARTVLVGFSQGTMMALHVGPEIVPSLGGIVGFSGRLLDEESLSRAPSRPPVFLAHGDADQMVPFASLGEAEKALRANGFDVETHVARGTGHGISNDGLGLALQFMLRQLGKDQSQR